MNCVVCNKHLSDTASYDPKGKPGSKKSPRKRPYCYKNAKCRLYARTVKDKDCLRFTGFHDDHGYGTVGYKGNTMMAHRLAYILEHGKIPKETPYILHSNECNFKDCIKLEHLRPGTHQENMDDFREQIKRKGELWQASEGLVRAIKRDYGENSKEFSLNTPRRVEASWKEFLGGYKKSPKFILHKQFPAKTAGIVLVRDIDFQSTCRHHLLPFIGVVHVAYIPGKRIVGLSKIPRLVDAFARRLQLQENLGTEIADALVKYLQPKGVAVIIKAQHFCTSYRGVRKENARMTTSSLRGAFLDQSVREELYFLLNNQDS